jgi:glycerate kinase
LGKDRSAAPAPERALFQYGEVILKQTGKEIRDIPGSGAAEIAKK